MNSVAITSIMPKCQICKCEEVKNFHYGAPSCKSCAMAFFRFVQTMKPLKCAKNPNLCVTGKVKSRQQCRKCRIDRCIQMGMKAELITVHFRRVTVQRSSFPQAIVVVQNFEHENFPLMSQISKGMCQVRMSIADRYRFNGLIRGASEQGDHYFGMECHLQLKKCIKDSLEDMVESLGYFSSALASAELRNFVNKDNVPFLSMYSNFSGYQNAKKQGATWFADNRNYVTPGFYVDRTYSSLYSHLRNSYPAAKDEDCAGASLSRYELRNNPLNRPIQDSIANDCFVDESCQDAFLILMLLDVAKDYYLDVNVQAHFAGYRQRLLIEMLGYYGPNAANEKNEMISDLLMRTKNLGLFQSTIMATFKTQMDAVRNVSITVVGSGVLGN